MKELKAKKLEEKRSWDITIHRDYKGRERDPGGKKRDPEDTSPWKLPVEK